MKNYRVEIDLYLSDEAYNLDWIFKAIEEQLEKNECLSGKWREVDDNEQTPQTVTDKLKEFFESQDPAKLMEALRCS